MRENSSEPERRRNVSYRTNALYFANAKLYHEVVLDAVAAAPSPVNWLVVAAEPVTIIDITSVDMLNELDDTLQQAGAELVFA